LGEVITRIKTDDAMWKMIPIRFTEAQNKKLREIAQKKKMKIAEIIRLAVDRLKI